MRLLRFLTLCVIGLYSECLFAQQGVYPIPQSLNLTGGKISLNDTRKLDVSKNVSQVNIDLLKSVIGNPRNQPSVVTSINVGLKGDRQVKNVEAKLPDNLEAYVIDVNTREITIAANTNRGLFYAIQTFSQIKNGNTILCCQIVDYPQIAHRGVVEGFYGTPWSHENRLSQLKFYGQYKLNTYIYGPKDDPYHSSPSWREPYPLDEASHIKELITMAAENYVDFVWAIHPGKDIKWNDEDRDKLLKKFESMYSLGVRGFAVFFDDIAGDGTDPKNQAGLLNYIQKHFIDKKKDVTPLIMCPTEYNKAWANKKPNTYLDILGDLLDPSIQIMWTGDKVISDITLTGMEWVNNRIKRKAYVWWNFPVNDYARGHLILGRCYGLDPDAAIQSSGFVSNPMERAEASKIALFSIANYTWNPRKFISEKSWKDAIATLLPNTYEEFLCFATHNSDMGKNGHGYRREESVNVKEQADRFINDYKTKGTYNNDDYKVLYSEFKKVAEVSSQIIKKNENPELIKEILPWLEQFETLGRSGKATLELLSYLKNPEVNARRISRVKSQLKLLNRQRIEIENDNNNEQYQPGVKAGSLVLQPFVDNFAYLVAPKDVTERSSSDAEFEFEDNINKFDGFITNIPNLEEQPLIVNGQNVKVAPKLEVVNMEPMQFLGITGVFNGNVSIDLNTPDFTWANVEVTLDGKKWETIEMSKSILTQTTSVLKVVKGIRVINASNDVKAIVIRKFIIDK